MAGRGRYELDESSRVVLGLEERYKLLGQGKVGQVVDLTVVRRREQTWTSSAAESNSPSSPGQ